MPGIEDILRMALAGGGGGGALPIDLPGMAGPEMPPEALMMALGGAGGGMVDPRMMGGPPMPMAPQMGPPQQQPQQPQQPPRNEWVKGLLSNFLYSLSQGLPVGAAHGSAAGFGAALGAPFRREQEERKMRLDEARAEDERASARLRVSSANRQDALVAAQLEQILAGVRGTNARTGTEGARQGLIGAQQGQIEAQTKKARYIDTDNGLFDISTGKIIEGTQPGTLIPITREIQQKYSLPEGLIGRSIKAGDINSLSGAESRNQRIVRTKEGVMQLDLATGEKEKIGNLPPPQAVGAFLPVYGQGGATAGFYNPRQQSFSPLPEGVFTKYPGVDMTRMVTNAKNGLRSLAKLRTEMERDPNILAKAAIPGGLFARKFLAYKKEITDVITRLRTGAALNVGEQKFYNEQMPGALDLLSEIFGEEGVSAAKLEQYEQILAALASAPIGTSKQSIEKLGAGGVMDAIRGGGKKAAPGGGDRVTVIAPDGKRGTIPRSQLTDALKQGYKQ